MLAPKLVPSIEIYSEDPGEHAEASKEDIEEFAKRIGIDTENETHLLYLAKDGLEEKLPPGWKPCRDNIKREWYYFNKESNISQWEHPLNDIYRVRVSQTRADLAMKRIQAFDSSNLKPRSLPPLKLGNGRPPTGMNRLGPVEGLAALNKSLSKSDLQRPRDRAQSYQTASLGDLQTKSDNSDDQSLKNPSTRMVKKPLGLTLTGEGANFLKGSDRSSNKGSLFDKKDISIPYSTGTEAKKEPLKSILTSLNQSQIQSRKDKKFEPWGINPDSLTEEEKKIIRELETGQQKPSVKFQLDENPVLNFEISTDENDASEDKKSDASESEEDSELEEDEDASESLPFGRIQSKIETTQSQKYDSDLGNSTSRGNMGAGEKISYNISEPSTEAKKELHTNMEAKLKEYQDELDKERRDREQQIKKHMDMSVEQLKKEKEAAIKRARNDMEQSKNIELDKVKRELDSVLKIEVDKMKLAFEKELKDKNNKLQEQNDQMLDRNSMDLDLDDGIHNDTIRRNYSEETLKLHAELKIQKEIMKEDQKKQILQMKDYHKTFIDKLKADYKLEETKLLNEHQLKISGIMAAFEKETAQMKSKVKSEQDVALRQLMIEFETEKSKVEIELREGISSLNKDLKELQSNVKSSPKPVSVEVANQSSQTKKTEDEVKALSVKYNQLEKKYVCLKKELRKITSVNNCTQTASLKQSNESVNTISKNEPGTLITQQEVSESASESPSETSFYPSSSINRHVDKISDINADLDTKDMFVDNNDRLTSALKSLEILKSQILDIKQDQVTEKSNPKTSKPSGRSSPRPTKKTARNVSPSPISSSRTPKKKNNQAGQKTPKKSVPITPPPTRNGRIRPSKSTSELPEVVENSEESNEIVKEAKEFIRSQKERLNVPSNAKFDKPILTTWTSNNTPRYSLDDISYPSAPTVKTYAHSPKHDLYSETESSGVGSLQDLKSQEKKQISKDIEAICSSLSHLDDQMRLMWTVVQGNSQEKSNALNHNNVVASLPNHIPGKSSSARKTPNHRPVTSMDLQSLAPSVMSTSNRAFIDTIKATNLPSSRMSASNLLSSLDKELKEFKAAKERILSQYTNQQNAPSETIQEKTKDLREWLEKF